MPDNAVSEVFYDAWEETKVIQHDAGYNGTQLNKWAKAFGTIVTDILDRAKLPEKPGKLELPELCAQLQKPGVEG